MDLVDPRSVDAGSTAAMDHLEWCRPCGEELQDLALAIVALRRLGDEPETRRDDAAAWPRVSARILHARAAAGAVAWRWRASLAGLATGIFIVTAVVGPLALRVPLAGGHSEPTGLSPVQLEGRARRVEARYIWQASTGSVSASTTRAVTQVVQPRYPDGVQPERKEVPARSTGRPLKAD